MMTVDEKVSGETHGDQSTINSSQDIKRLIIKQLSALLELDYNRQIPDEYGRIAVGNDDIFTPLCDVAIDFGLPRNQKLANPVYWFAIVNIVTSQGMVWQLRDTVFQQYQDSSFLEQTADQILKKHEHYLIANIFGLRTEPEIKRFKEKENWQ